MKKKAITAAVVLAFAIAFSGCKFNLFSSLDTLKISIPNFKTASSDSIKQFVNDVQKYVDEGANIDNTKEVVDALTIVYTNPPDIETGQRAAILSGDISITADPKTKDVVDKVVSTMTEISDPDYQPPDNESDTEALLKGLFPKDDSDFSTIYDNLKTAAAAYTDFAKTIDTDGDGKVDDPDNAATWIQGSEKGDIATYAIVSIAVTTFDEKTLHDFLYGKGVLGSTDPVNNSNTILALIDFSGLDI